jgi:hypothetical protein
VFDRSETHEFTLPLRVQDKFNDNSDHDCWNVVADHSIQLEPLQVALLREDGCDVYGVEVTSRVLSVDQAKQTSRNTTETEHNHTTTYQNEITSVLNSMNEAFLPQGSAVDHHQQRRMVVNETCALHVHIGNGTKGFELQTVKNLLIVCTAFERVMDSMHAASRIGCSTLALAPLDEFSACGKNGKDLASDAAQDPKTFNKALTERLSISAYLTRRNDKHDPELKVERNQYPAVHMDQNNILKQAASAFHTEAFIEVVQQASSIEHLQELLGSCSETSVNILHLVTKPSEDQILNKARPYRRLNTIEFRQHAATTDPQDALRWIDFLQTLVKYAHSQSAQTIRSACELAASDPHFDLKAMFKLLGVAQETQTFYLNRNNAKFHSAIHEAEQLSLDDPFRGTVLALAKKRADDHDPAKISERIKTKFEEGGYGQCSREFIDAYAPALDKEGKERLTIGWEAPLWSSMEDDGDRMKD